LFLKSFKHCTCSEPSSTPHVNDMFEVMYLCWFWLEQNQFSFSEYSLQLSSSK